MCKEVHLASFFGLVFHANNALLCSPLAPKLRKRAMPMRLHEPARCAASAGAGRATQLIIGVAVAQHQVIIQKSGSCPSLLSSKLCRKQLDPIYHIISPLPTSETRSSSSVSDVAD